MTFHVPLAVTTRVIRHAHLFCGIGAGAKGFNMAKARVGQIEARYECAGGIDVDEGAIDNFQHLTGVRGTVLDLFDEAQYREFWEAAPPPGWREAQPADIRRTFGPGIDVAFTSPPCKGLSGLLSATKSKTDKYQALNRLTVRGIWLLLEAYKDDPIPIILFENVPRISTRGRPLLDQICALLRSYGYNVAETVHDCGELGGLAQSRKRFLLIARQRAIIPNFIYTPHKHRLRGVGEVIGKLPLPGDPIGGPMHRVPKLQWKTWLRLALVPAGRDWRALNELEVVDGVLRDYGIIPDKPMRDNVLGVCAWGDTAPVIIGNQRSPLHGRVSVADIRLADARNTAFGVLSMGAVANLIAGESMPSNGAYAIADPSVRYQKEGSGWLGVNGWGCSIGVISTRGLPTNGAYSIADVRFSRYLHHGVMGVVDWFGSSGLVAAASRPANGPHSIADIRVDGHPKSVMLGVRPWQGKAAAAVKGDCSVGTGPYAIADLRIPGKPRFNNTFRIVPLDRESPAIHGPGGPAGGIAVADVRAAHGRHVNGKYRVLRYREPATMVIAASTTGNGAYVIADVRAGPYVDHLQGNWSVAVWIGPARAVTGNRKSGAAAIADVRCNWGNRHESVLRVTAADDSIGAITSGGHSVTGGQPAVADDRRESYQTCGHYGVWGWGQTSGTVSATLGHDNGPGNVADPRPKVLDVEEPFVLPKPDDRLICRIISTDETWHRPFTTLELAALQSIVDPEEAFYQDAEGVWRCRFPVDLESSSDAMKREWIGNAVPSASAQGIAETIAETILLAELGETFTLSTREIWVKPGALAMAVDTDQVAYRMDAGQA